MNQEQEATGPGIVVLSSSLQVLHMNRRAMALLTQLERTAQRIGTDRAVATPLHQHCQDITEAMRHAWQRTTGNNSINTARSAIQPTRSYSKDSACLTAGACPIPGS